LRGFAERVAAETGIIASLAESPLTCVVRGSGRSLEELGELQGTGLRSRRRGILTLRRKRLLRRIA
jgi:actin-like ATPase involved in cell morphogenesis